MTFLTTLLLQVHAAPATADSLVNAAQQDASTSVEKISLLHLLAEGGVLMIPLLLCSLVLVYVFLERWFAIRKASAVMDKSFMKRIQEQVEAHNKEKAVAIAKESDGPVARVIEKGLTRIDKPVDTVEKSMENAGKLETYKLEKNLTVISAIAGIAPILGFLGTIAGMIILFFNVQHQGFSLETIAGGIYTKMVTSATGLIIGLLAYVAYAYLNAQINKIVNRMEAAAVELLDIIQDTTV